MKKNLLIAALLPLSLGMSAQDVIFSANKDAIFYVGEKFMVYNGGGVQTVDNAIYEVHGDVMIEGSGADAFRTINSGGGTRTDGGNFILRLNDPSSPATSTYGQLYINGLTQGNISAVVDKEYRTEKHGTYQQIAMPFSNKTLSSLSGSTSTIGTLGKTFDNTRWKQNEILKYTNNTVVANDFSVSTATSSSTAYYMLGSKNLDAANPPAEMPANPVNGNAALGSVYTLRGVPYANGVAERLVDAGKDVVFGTNGEGKNSYGEKYNSYVQDAWDISTPWSGTFGKNIYQFGNPYFTNLDFSFVGYAEPGLVTDNVELSKIQGIRFSPGSVVSREDGSTYSTNAQFINFTDSATPTPVGDVGLIIKPMQAFVIKMRDNAPEVTNPSLVGNRTLAFDNLRRFSDVSRASGTDYSVNAARGAVKNKNTVKQLGVIALDENGEELSRTYYAVYPTATTGYTTKPTTQSRANGNHIIGTFEEDLNGGYDMDAAGKYWLYINEANEVDFFGKAVPLVLYSPLIKSLKFEIRENMQLIKDGDHNLSTGIGFYYKTASGSISEIAQSQVIPVTTDEYNLYYGKSSINVGTKATLKQSRTKVVYNTGIDKFVINFDTQWKKAEINVYDMSGKLILSEKNVLTEKDFVINLSKMNAGYIVTAVSETGDKISSKIIR